MRTKVFAAAVVAVALLATVAPPARASLWTGSCVLRITVNFNSAVRVPFSAPSYSLDVAGVQDLDPLTTGTQPCATTMTGTQVFHPTSVGDRVFGGGPDVVAGGRGADFLDGGRGRDTCRGGRGANQKRGCDA